MTKNLLLLSFFLLIGFSLTAQKSVMLKIEHRFNGMPVEYDQMVDAENGSFMLNWVSYYLSDFSLLNGASSEINIQDSYVLVEMDKPGYYKVGEANISEVTGMKFHIGIPESVNHNDPASWPEDHPLNYQEPGMHWGWAGGYIFFVFNGSYDADHGNTPEDLFDMEAIGDPLYRDYEMELTTGVEVTENEIWINIEADYYKLTAGINMPYSNHGNDPTLAKMMNNVIDEFLFTESIVSSDIDIHGDALKVSSFPNPSDGKVLLNIQNNDGLSPISIQVFNSLGQTKKALDLKSEENEISLSFDASGTYYLVVRKAEQIVGRQKLIIL